MNNKKKVNDAYHKKNHLFKNKNNVLIKTRMNIRDIFKFSTSTNEGKMLFYFIILFIIYILVHKLYFKTIQ